MCMQNIRGSELPESSPLDTTPPWNDHMQKNFEIMCEFAGKKLVGFQRVVIVLSSWHIFDSTTSKLNSFISLSYPSSMHRNVKLLSIKQTP